MDALAERIVNTIAAAIQPVKIILFGSRAHDRAKPDSDVDLLVIYDGRDSRRDVMLKIRRLFTPQDFAMDLFVLSSAEFEQQKHIVATVGRVAATEGVVYFGGTHETRIDRRTL